MKVLFTTITVLASLALIVGLAYAQGDHHPVHQEAVTQTEALPWQTLVDVTKAASAGIEGQCPGGVPNKMYILGDENNTVKYIVFVGGGNRFVAVRPDKLGQEAEYLWFGIVEQGKLLVNKAEPFDANKHESPCKDWIQ